MTPAGSPDASILRASSAISVSRALGRPTSLPRARRASRAGAAFAAQFELKFGRARQDPGDHAAGCVGRMMPSRSDRKRCPGRATRESSS